MCVVKCRGCWIGAHKWARLEQAQVSGCRCRYAGQLKVRQSRLALFQQIKAQTAGSRIVRSQARVCDRQIIQGSRQNNIPEASQGLVRTAIRQSQV